MAVPDALGSSGGEDRNFNGQRDTRTREIEETSAELGTRGLHWSIALVLSLWCLCWLADRGYNYLHLTWRLFTRLKWASFALIINPCFDIWILVFSSAVRAPFNLLWWPWGRYGRDFTRGKVALLVFLAPPLLGLVLRFIGPYFYPITWGGENGTSFFLRFVPLIGGRGYS